MSYATSLLMAYPPPYGPSTLLSDDLVQQSSLRAFYEPPVPYTSGNRLFSDNFTYNPIGLDPISYPSSTYQNFPSTYQNFPSTNYRTPLITNWQADIPGQTSYGSINNVREYSESLDTASSTNTASSIAHSIDENNINGTMNMFPNYQQNYNRVLNDVNKSPHLTTIWSPTRPKITTNDEKPALTHRSVPELSATIGRKKSSTEELKKDTTPIPSPPPPPPVLTNQENNLQRNPTLLEIERQPPSLDTQAWLSESKTELPNNEKPAEEVWTDKIDQLHTTQAQREKEKEKAKSSRALPNIKKPVDNKPKVNDNKTRITSFQRRNDSYFDILFDGNYLRKTSNNQQNSTVSYQPNKSTTNLFNKPKTTIFPKNNSPRKPSQYQPPSVTRAPPTITTTSWKKQGPALNQSGSNTSRENIHKDADERFREALQKFRSDRAEQQQKEFTESTAKRLNYGDYVRRSTKDALLHNVIRPSPWSDFLDMKKGNVYSLTQEEKKDLYNQSKSYGERVRNRNFVLHHGAETARSTHHSLPFPVYDQDSQSGDETSPEPTNEDANNSKSLKRSDSTSTIKTTNKTFTKNTGGNDMISNRSGRTTKLSDQSSSTMRPSEEEDDDISAFESSHKQKKSFFDSSVRTTTATEDSENDETSEQQSTRMKYRDTDDDLFTVREEKTLESLKNDRS